MTCPGCWTRQYAPSARSAPSGGACGEERRPAPRPGSFYYPLEADWCTRYIYALEFDWDPPKNDRTRRERGFGFDYAVRIFAGRTLEMVDRRKDYGEEWVKAIGEIDGIAFVVIFTDRGKLRWIISAWKASRKDYRLWLNHA